MKKNTILTIQQKKQKKEPIVMVTAYDHPSAKIVDEAGVDIILVGDSVGMTMLGYDSTVQVAMSDMLHHSKAVARAKTHALVVADMPFMAAQVSFEKGIKNATKLIQEGGAQAVKIEGAGDVLPLVKRLVDSGIPVMGHLGLTPQSVHQLGGYRVQGKDDEAVSRLLEEAKELEKAGVFALVLECIPEDAGTQISGRLGIPTIGIGAGRYTDGQVLVFHDLLGYGSTFKPKFVKQYAAVGEAMKDAVTKYTQDVKQKKFPAKEHCYNK